jgi:hypothetical protein
MALLVECQQESFCRTEWQTGLTICLLTVLRLRRLDSRSYCTVAAAMVSLGKSNSGSAFTSFTVSRLTVIT